jgi:hypothetical protein
MEHLLYLSRRHGAGDYFALRFEPNRCDVSERCQFVVIDVAAFAFCEAEQEHRPYSSAEGDQDPKAARLSLAWPRHALLDYAAAEIGIKQSALRPADRYA